MMVKVTKQISYRENDLMIEIANAVRKAMVDGVPTADALAASVLQVAHMLSRGLGAEDAARIFDLVAQKIRDGQAIEKLLFAEAVGHA